MFTPDDLAGIVDLFGALTRGELAEALSELAYRQGADVPEDAIDDAIDAFALVAFERGDESEELLAPGPAAFPTLPDGAEDLPHILDVESRGIDRAAVGRAAEERLRVEAAQAVAAGDTERADELLDVSYDLEAWGGVDLGSVRERLDAADGTN
ncbi:MAG: hypothetical protein ACI8UR_000415 [Natronomonas sp.]|jgi:hypothetical protein|uniref:DUF7109 family protein n=1 Tax=Natronomonas sp. TaxID=2184060 RepID=UPI0039890EA5